MLAKHYYLVRTLYGSKCMIQMNGSMCQYDRLTAEIGDLTGILISNTFRSKFLFHDAGLYQDDWLTISHWCDNLIPTKCTINKTNTTLTCKSNPVFLGCLNLIANISDTISNLSSATEIFDKIAPYHNNALTNSSFKHQIHYNRSSKNINYKNRPRKMI